RLLSEPAGALRVRPRQHLARPERARIAGGVVRRESDRARDQRLALDVAPRIPDVPDGPRARSDAAVDRVGRAAADRLRQRVPAVRDALSARKMGLVFSAAQSLGLARRIFRYRAGSLSVWQ